MRLLLISLVFAILAPAAAQARCRPSALQVSVLTSPRVAVPLDGSFLVQLERAFQRERSDSFPDNLSISLGSRRIGVELVAIAPGLARATPRRSPSPGAWRLGGSHVGGARVITFASGAMPAALPSLRVRRVTQRRTPPSRRAPPQHEVSAALAQPLPAGIVAIAIVDARGRGSWMPAQPGATTAAVHPATPRCSLPPSGFTALAVGSRARLIAVDGYGRALSSDELVVESP